jgi:hypothetical protein
MGASSEAYYAVVENGMIPIGEQEAIEWEACDRVKCVPHFSRHTGRHLILFGLLPADAWEIIDELPEGAAEIIDRLITAELPECDPSVPLPLQCCARLEAGLPLPLAYDRLDTAAAAGSPEAIHQLDTLRAAIRENVEPYTDLSPLDRGRGVEESLVRRGIV